MNKVCAWTGRKFRYRWITLCIMFITIVKIVLRAGCSLEKLSCTGRLAQADCPNKESKKA